MDFFVPDYGATWGPGDKPKSLKGAEMTQETFSRFGGFWIDRIDCEAELERRRASGTLAEDMASLVQMFMRDGCVVIKNAVPKDLTAGTKSELEQHWRSPPPGAKIEHWTGGENYIFVSPDLRYRDGPTKLLDFHAFSKTARQAIAAPKVVAFLSAIFEAKPKAFQSLTFWRGSQQDIHKDSAYVQVDGAPMKLAASWLALEDVDAGAGELEYYVGSHRAPDFLFAGEHKWLEAAPHEHDQFLASHHEDAVKYGFKKSSFLASEGDVLIWHADLAHGGSVITKPNSTRQSLVTHFTPETENPPYARNRSIAPIEVGGCQFISVHRL